MKLSHIVRLAGIALVGVMLSQQGFAKEKVYTWTDSKGTVHYGERPPKDTPSKLVHTRTGHSDPTPVPTSPLGISEPVADSAGDDAQASQKDPERCATAQENLTLLNTSARVKIKNAEGILVYLTEEDKVKQRETMQIIINQSCE